MKILNIELKNLNSLRGEWRIDLTDNAYTSGGIFAVTGSTGAGKSTIFDAVCLALYGKTPRLKNFHKYEIMSKHTRTCTARVKFEVEGKIYSCEWSQSKIRNEFKTTHTINENGQRLQDSAEKAVEKITGLNFQQFTQTMLLAQGEFDKFLRANDADRSKILEQVTGTEIYSSISTAIYERQKKERKELDWLQARLEEIKPRDNFGTDEEIARSTEETRQKSLKADEEYSETQAEFNWLKNIHDIRHELSRQNLAMEAQKRESENFASERSRLETALRAKEINPCYLLFDNKRKQVSKNISDCEKLKAEIEAERSKLSQLEKEAEASENLLKQKTASLPENETPDSLCAKALFRVDDFVKIYKDKSTAESNKAKAEQELKQARSSVQEAEQLQAKAREEYEHIRDKLSEIVNLKASAIIEAERRKLKPGCPCPVCGSLEHPALSHSETEQSSSGELVRYDDELVQTTQREKSALKKLQEAEKISSQRKNHEGNCREKVSQFTEQIEEYQAKIIEAKQSVNEMILPMGIVNVKNCEEIIYRVKKWRADINSLSDRVNQINSDIMSTRKIIETKSEVYEKAVSSLASEKRELESLSAVFAKELSEKNFADEKHFTASIIPDAKLSGLQRKAKSIDDEISRLQAVVANIEDKLRKEEARAVTDKSLEEAEKAMNEKKNEADSLHRQLITLEEAMRNRRKIEEDYRKVEEERRKQSEIYGNWQAFSDELGQKDGGLFREFVQRMTLQMMVNQANIQLSKMNNRYTLTADNKLSLSVVDNEQGGVIRTTDNLSGGERFIISLALALGLSQISGSRAQVDSLFIDEGFGSLDDDALNSALEALAEIKREGRMIGIISHVSGISERVPAKIHVIRKSEGTSIIEGPGCSRVG